MQTSGEKKVRVLVSGDPHLKVSNMATSRLFLDWMYKLQLELQPDMVIMLGDQFDTHSIVRVEVLNLWVDYLKKCAPASHVMLKGNHDEISPGSNVHALVALEKLATIVDRPVTLGRLSFIQYIHDEEAFAKALEELDGKILFCHQTFQGAQYENGFYDPNGFSTSLLERFNHVVSGHIHKSQRVGRVFYPGTPYATNFSDAGERKGAYLMDISENNIESMVFHESPCPKYHVLRLSDPERASKFFDECPTTQDHFKLVLSAPRASVRSFGESQSFKTAKKRLKITFSPQYTDTVKRKLKISEEASMEDMLSKYVEDIHDTRLDRERLHDTAKEILGRAKLK
jgi:DNA repair exonuclease SbcCD nuclease subunit